mgnify:FL=1|jgi:nitrite reductase/ring-hydroxylating ferredoxin subunit
MEYQGVLHTPDLGPGQMREVEAHGEILVLLNVGQTYYALSAHCPNDGVNLAREGRLKGDLLICPGDGWAFDVRTGQRVDPPGGPRLTRYPIIVEENLIKVGRLSKERGAA